MIPDYEIHRRREEKGRRLSSQVMEHRNGFYVRSESQGAKLYNVKIENGEWKCDCKDFQYRADDLRRRFNFNCAHILAVEFALQYGSVHGTRSIEESRERVQIKQRGAPRRRSYGHHL